MKIQFIVLLIGLTLFGCGNASSEKSETTLSLNEFIYFTMKDAYLWYDKIPNVDYASYTDPQTLVDDLSYKTFDKWSYIVKLDKKSTSSLNVNQYEGYGFGLIWNNENDKIILRINYVYEYSPAYRANLSRGYRIISVNDLYVAENPSDEQKKAINDEFSKGSSLSLLIWDSTNTERRVTLEKGIVTKDYIIYTKLFEKGSKKIAYMVYNEFDTYSDKDLSGDFKFFKEKNIDELIIDLRYNPGGSVSLSHKIANLIAGYNNEGKIYQKMVYNDRRLQNRINLYLKKEQNSIDLKRVIFITSNQSASASEALINGLKPLMEVKIFGGKTHGKPVGMNGIFYGDYLFFPITFKGYNSKNVGEYYNGLEADKEAKDDARYAFGDESSDECLKNALYYAENGAFRESVFQDKKSAPQNEPYQYQGYNKYLNSF